VLLPVLLPIIPRKEMTATEKEKCKGGREELCTSQGEENNLSEAKHDERVEDEDSLLVLGARQDGDGFTRFPFLPRIDGAVPQRQGHPDCQGSREMVC